MSRHQADLLMCLKQPGTSEGLVCEKCEGRCPICDSYDVRPTETVRICDECSFGNLGNKCIICGSAGKPVAYYCYECVMTEKSRDGCPMIVTIGSSKSDMYFEKRKKILD